MNDPLVWVRTVHFAATILVSGVVFFRAFIAEPAFRKAGGNEHVAAVVRSRLAWFAWVGLVFIVISGAAWLFFVAARMIDVPLLDAFSDGTVWTVLTGTDFGHDWIVRLVLAGLLPFALFPVPDAQAVGSHWRTIFALLLAAGIVGTLAWAGHAAAGTGLNGTVHLVADIFHLIAAAGWVGALIPLAVLLAAATRGREGFSVILAREAVSRFSTLGIASVGTLVTTGIINAWMLVGSLAAFINTHYGGLLLVKIMLFLAMLAIASINRMILTPHLMRMQATAQLPLRQLRNNSLIEAALGTTILFIVGVLGILPPGIQE